MIVCCHRECDKEAIHRIDLPNWYSIDVCDEHRSQIDHANKKLGGSSVINTKDNIFGWYVREDDPELVALRERNRSEGYSHS